MYRECTQFSKNVFKDQFLNQSYNEFAITTILKHSSFKNNTARQIFSNSGILALLPISKTKTSIVWSIKKNTMNKYKNSSNLFFKKKIKIDKNKTINIFLNDTKRLNKNKIIIVYIRLKNKSLNFKDMPKKLFILSLSN